MANRRPLFVAASGTPTMIAAPDTIDPAIQSSLFPNGITAGSSVVSGSANAFNFAAIGFSANTPYIGNSSDGGLNASVAAASTFGYRFFKYDGTTLTQLLQITPSGGVAAAGTVSATGAIIGGGGAALQFNNATSNYVMFNTAGLAPPATTTRSNGTREVYYPSLSSSATDYARGMDSGTLWDSVPSGGAFKWYGNTVLAGTLTDTGTFTIPGTLNAAYGVVAGSGTVGVAGDILTARNGTQGCVEFGSAAGSKGALYYDTSNYYFYNPGIATPQLYITAANGNVVSNGSFNFAGVYNYIGTAAGNGVLQVPGAGALFLNYSTGTGGIIFGNGQTGTAASISAAGLFSVPTISATGIYHSFGNTTNGADLHSLSTAPLYLNLSAGGPVTIGNGAGGSSGTQFNTNGSVAIAQYLNIGTYLCIGTINTGVSPGDAMFSRSPTQGVAFLGSNGSHYLQFDGTYYRLPNASLYVSTTLYASSRKLKENVAPIAFDSVAKVKQLSVVSFNYKANVDHGSAAVHGGNTSATKQHGIIAEDTPREFLSPEGDALDAHTTLAIALDAIKQLTLRVEQLEAEKKAA